MGTSAAAEWLVWINLRSRRSHMMQVTTAVSPPHTPYRAVLVGLGRGPQESLCCVALSVSLWGPKTAVLLSPHGVRGNEDSLPASLASLVFLGVLRDPGSTREG